MTQPLPRNSEWGRDPLWPNETAYEDGIQLWLSRETIPDAEEAITQAAGTLGLPREQVQLVPVLMRVESEVEAKITGHDFPLWVECTARAKSSARCWRVEHLV